jgi:hypothetical protein
MFQLVGASHVDGCFSRTGNESGYWMFFKSAERVRLSEVFQTRGMNHEVGCFKGQGVSHVI